MDTLRSMGAKILDKTEQNEASTGNLKRATAASTEPHITSADSRYLLLLGSIQTLLPILSDVTEALWLSAHSYYQVYRLSDDAAESQTNRHNALVEHLDPIS